MVIIALGISLVIILGTFVLNKRSYGQEKLTQYECGFEPLEEKPGIETRDKFFIRFYIIAIIFLIFDLEAILLYPFTTISDPIGNNIAYIIFSLFMVILILGLYYEIKKGVLN